MGKESINNEKSEDFWVTGAYNYRINSYSAKVDTETWGNALSSHKPDNNSELLRNVEKEIASVRGKVDRELALVQSKLDKDIVQVNGEVRNLSSKWQGLDDTLKRELTNYSQRVWIKVLSGAIVAVLAFLGVLGFWDVKFSDFQERTSDKFEDTTSLIHKNTEYTNKLHRDMLTKIEDNLKESRGHTTAELEKLREALEQLKSKN